MKMKLTHQVPVETAMIGDRVQLHPATDLWMQGARYGTILYMNAGSPWWAVDLDSKAEAVKVHINDIYEVYATRR